jgi:hypothetical protein
VAGLASSRYNTDHHPILAMHPLQREIYRKMTPEQKLRASLSLYYSAWTLKKADVHKQHPDWEEKKVLQAVRKAFLSASA